MNDNELIFLSVLVVTLIGFFVFGMFHIKKMLLQEKNILRAIMLPLILGFILALGLLIVAFGLM